MTTISITHLLGSAQVGGTERQLLMLLKGLNQAQFVQKVVLIRGGPLERDFQALAPTMVIGKRSRLDPAFLMRLVRHLPRQRSDILHTWLPTANLWGGLSSFLRPSHLVTSERGIDSWKGSARERIDRIIAMRADRIVANSRAVAAAVESRSIHSRKVRIIVNGVEEGGPSAVPRSANLIVLLGRFDPVKGHDLLVKALPAVLRSCPNARVVCAGPAVLPAELAFLRQIAATVKTLGLSPRVELRGPIDDPRSLIQRATVLVLPSREEGLPNVLLEAMIEGTPVIAARVGGVPEVLENGRWGHLVPPDDPISLAETLIRLLGHIAEANALAEAAKVHVTKRFSVRTMVTSWARLYEEIVTSPCE